MATRLARPSLTRRWLAHVAFRLYNLAFYSYVIAFAHFNSELLIYRTTKLGKGWLGPAVVSSTSSLRSSHASSDAVGTDAPLAIARSDLARLDDAPARSLPRERLRRAGETFLLSISIRQTLAKALEKGQRRQHWSRRATAEGRQPRRPDPRACGHARSLGPSCRSLPERRNRLTVSMSAPFQREGRGRETHSVDAALDVWVRMEGLVPRARHDELQARRVRQPEDAEAVGEERGQQRGSDMRASSALRDVLGRRLRSADDSDAAREERAFVGL